MNEPVSQIYRRPTRLIICFITTIMALSACSEFSFLPRHPEAPAAVGRLLSNDQLLQSEARVEILALGEGAMPELRERFEEASPEQRKKIVELVSTIGKPDEVVRDVFIAAGRDPSPAVRQIVAFRAVQYPQLQRELFPTLHALASDSVPEVQAAAISSLGTFSTLYSLTPQELTELMQNRSPLVVAAAATVALSRPEPSLRDAAQEALPGLVGEIMNPSPLVRAAVIIAIGKYGPSARHAVPPLVGSLSHDPLAEIRLQAAIALMKTKLLSARRVALPALQAFANNPNPALALTAQRVLASEAPSTPAAPSAPQPQEAVSQPTTQ